MTFASINDFKAKFQGGARPNLFRVIQPFPVSAAFPNVTERMMYFCKAAQLPGIDSGTIDVPYLGRNLKTSGDRTFQQMSLTVINDIDFLIRNSYEKWMNLINQHESNTGLIVPADYMVDMTIEQLGRDGSTLKTYTLIGAYPQSIAPIDVDFASNDTLEEFAVTLEYQYWTDPINGIV